MRDTFDRQIDYMRISVTDRCNLRCIYCMPETGVEFMPHSQILSYEEIIRVCTQMAKAGIRKVKVTGGEPLVRKGLPDLISGLNAIPGIEDVTLTTNGVLLKDKIQALKGAGISAINISLDTLDRSRYKALTRYDCLDQVLKGIDEALKYQDISLKLNCVPVKGPEGYEDILNLAKMAKERDIHVRFIELMPIGLGQDMDGWNQELIQAALESCYGGMVPYKKPLGNGPCVYYSVPGFQGKIGFISAVSHKFCDRCNRIRLTSDGFLKTCLQYGLGESLLPLLRDGSSDQYLLDKITGIVRNKPKEHQFEARGRSISDQEKKKMFRIGG